jgi:hypothetical protein
MTTSEHFIVEIAVPSKGYIKGLWGVANDLGTAAPGCPPSEAQLSPFPHDMRLPQTVFRFFYDSLSLSGNLF